MTATIRTADRSRRSVATGLGATGVAVASGAGALASSVAFSIGESTASVPLASGLISVVAGAVAAVFTGSVRASNRTAPRPEARTRPT